MNSNATQRIHTKKAATKKCFAFLCQFLPFRCTIERMHLVEMWASIFNQCVMWMSRHFSVAFNITAWRLFAEIVVCWMQSIRTSHTLLHRSIIVICIDNERGKWIGKNDIETLPKIQTKNHRKSNKANDLLHVLNSQIKMDTSNRTKLFFFSFSFWMENQRIFRNNLFDSEIQFFRVENKVFFHCMLSTHSIII